MKEISPFDGRRSYIIPGDVEETISFAAHHWIHTALRSIQQRGRFAVALSGGATPKAIYQKLLALWEQKGDEGLDWGKVHLFWSDERGVPPDHPESNYRMALESGLKKLPISPSHIHRMEASPPTLESASLYEQKIEKLLGKELFDLVMLGIGEDGHTASLFPGTEALKEEKRLVIPNYLPDKNVWRMTLTFPCIERSRKAVFYLLGEGKRGIVPQVLLSGQEGPFPASRVGTTERPALLILDRAAARDLPQ